MDFVTVGYETAKETLDGSVKKEALNNYFWSEWRVPEWSSVRAHALGGSGEHSVWKQVWPLLNIFRFLLSRGGGEGESHSNASSAEGVVLFPQTQPSAASQPAAAIGPAAACHFVLMSSGLRQTSTCVCTVLGM